MRRNSRTIGVVAAVVTVAGVAFVHGRGVGDLPGVAKVRAAEVAEGQEVVGEPHTRTVGTAAVYVPPALAVHDGAFDVVIHFHGMAKLQEENVAESGLRAAVVSVNEGAGSGQYTRAVSSSGSLERLLGLAAREVQASRSPDLRVGRVALSAWSAGGGAVREILQRDADRVDAVIVADGLFSSFEGGGAVATRPLEPFVKLGELALKGERFLFLTHTAIPTPDYPNVEACTASVLDALGVARGEPGSSPPAGGEPTYSVRSGALVVRGYDGKTKEDHVAQIRALDVAYGELRQRWGD